MLAFFLLLAILQLGFAKFIGNLTPIDLPYVPLYEMESSSQDVFDVANTSFVLSPNYYAVGKHALETAQIMLRDNNFCFVIGMRSVQDNERCQVFDTYVSGNYWWVLQSQSNNDNYECGVRCVTFT